MPLWDGSTRIFQNNLIPFKPHTHRTVIHPQPNDFSSVHIPSLQVEYIFTFDFEKDCRLGFTAPRLAFQHLALPWPQCPQCNPSINSIYTSSSKLTWRGGQCCARVSWIPWTTWFTRSYWNFFSLHRLISCWTTDSLILICVDKLFLLLIFNPF